MGVHARYWRAAYSLDALNRPVGTVYIDGTRVTNTFDAASQQQTSQDITGIASYVWDLDGRKVVTVNPTGIILTATLDPAGNRLVLRDIGGSTSYVWDSQDRLVSILNPLNEITSIAWDALDREQHRILANGMAVSHTFDPAGRETLLENRNAAGIGLAVFTNSYDAVSNRLNVLELDGTRVSYVHDPSYQLINEQRSGVNAYNTSYIYDGMGNRFVKNDSGLLTTGTFNTANEIVLLEPPTGPPTTSTWDVNGNLSVENAGGVLTTHVWDSENRLSSVTTVTLETYQYSQDGLRKKKINPSGTTVFTWDDLNLVLESNMNNLVQARYTGYPGYWGGLASQSRTGTSTFFGFDSQGSTHVLVNLAGVVTDNLSFNAFGEPLQSVSGTNSSYGYVGQFGYYFDALNRLYVEARELNPTLGRWLARDDIRFAPYGNRYDYVGNNPCVLIDPDGNQARNGRVDKKLEKLCEYLHDQVHPACHVDRSCVKLDDCTKCPQISLYTIINQNCLRIRVEVFETCPMYRDSGHKKQISEAYNSLLTCQEKFRKYCLYGPAFPIELPEFMTEPVTIGRSFQCQPLNRPAIPEWAFDALIVLLALGLLGAACIIQPEICGFLGLFLKWLQEQGQCRLPPIPALG